MYFLVEILIVYTFPPCYHQVDIFSFGMLLHHIMCGILPFQDLQNSVETKSAVISGRPILHKDKKV